MNRSLQKPLRAASPRLVAAVCALALLAACGSDEATVKSTATASATDAVADDAVTSVVAMVTEQASASGVELDQECVVETVELLNEADLALMAAAAAEASPDVTMPALSPEGEEIGASLTDCMMPKGDVGEAADAATVAEAVAFVVSEEGDAVDQA